MRLISLQYGVPGVGKQIEKYSEE